MSKTTENNPSPNLVGSPKMDAQSSEIICMHITVHNSTKYVYEQTIIISI